MLETNCKQQVTEISMLCVQTHIVCCMGLAIKFTHLKHFSDFENQAIAFFV